MNDFITIQNDGPNLVDTNYWSSRFCKAGYFFLSWNAGVARLLVPGHHLASVGDMRSASYAVISRGPWLEQGGRDSLEILFEDDSDAPYVIHLSVEQCDRMVSDAEFAGWLYIYTPGGKQFDMECRYRTVPEIPFTP